MLPGKAPAGSQKLRKQAISKIDKAVSRGVRKKETASRYVSRLSTRSAAA